MRFSALLVLLPLALAACGTTERTVYVEPQPARTVVISPQPGTDVIVRHDHEDEVIR